MSYETTLYIVREWSCNDPNVDLFATGEVLAMVELQSPDYEGKFHNLVSEQEDDPKPIFGLSPNPPDRQQDAVEFLRDIAETGILNRSEALKLSDAIEEGYITEDKYGQPLRMFDLDVIIEAIEEDLKKENYRRLRWALSLMRQIKADCPDYKLKVVTYGH